jgi:hypothetical protein
VKGFELDWAGIADGAVSAAWVAEGLMATAQDAVVALGADLPTMAVEQLGLARAEAKSFSVMESD